MKYKEGAESVYGKHWDGLLYEVSDRKDKIMIVFSGSEGGLEHAAKTAKYLYDHGIPALALGYFKTKHTPKNLQEIPVELIGEAMDYLKTRGYESIGIEGVSKGAELALVAAIVYPDLSCVIVKTPSWYYSEGLKKGQPCGSCCWSYKGKSLPFTPYNDRKINAIKLIWKAKEYNILPINLKKHIVKESIIPVERIQASILIFSTERDTIWPSAESGRKLCERLEENQFTYPYKHICFKQMSHMMLEYCGEEIKYFMKSEKEAPEICRKEREQMGEECIKWIEQVWINEKHGNVK